MLLNITHLKVGAFLLDTYETSLQRGRSKVWDIRGQMALFAVIALRDAANAVDEAVSKLPATDVYKIESGKWIVDSKATIAKELSISLGLRETSTHLVLAVKGYSGRTQPDLWEWLAAKWTKGDG